MIPDAHCHLDQLADPERAAHEAAEAGVHPILAVSMDSVSAEAVLRLRDRLRGLVLAGVGLHPSRIPEIAADEQERELRRLEALLGGADCVGEIGLDYKDAATDSDRARQREALDRQLEWAAARRLSVNLHSRRADREVMEAAIAFHEKTGLGALLHWFTHSKKLVRRAAQHGVFVSSGPSVLIDARTVDVAREIDEPVLLVETDSPVEYGAEGAARPVWAARVLERLATARGTSAKDLATIVRRNFDRYLGRELPSFV